MFKLIPLFKAEKSSFQLLIELANQIAAFLNINLRVWGGVAEKVISFFGTTFWDLSDCDINKAQKPIFKVFKIAGHVINDK